MIPGMNKKQMKQMERQMKKMGMKMEDLEGVKEVIIRFEDKELIINWNMKLKFLMKMLKWWQIQPMCLKRKQGQLLKNAKETLQKR